MKMARTCFVTIFQIFNKVVVGAANQLATKATIREIVQGTIMLSQLFNDFMLWQQDKYQGECFVVISRVSCQKGPTRHAYAWQIGPFWQDTLDIWGTILAIAMPADELSADIIRPSTTTALVDELDIVTSKLVYLSIILCNI